MTEYSTNIPPDAIMVHPPHGWIWLDPDSSASDISVVNAAKASFGERVTQLDDRGKGIISFMMRNNHTSPFEHGMFKFLVKAPIFVTREWFRHRTWSYNEFSTRYSEVSPDQGFYLPGSNVHMRSQVGKPGHYQFEPLPKAKAAAAYKILDRLNTEAFNAYLQLTGDIGLAKEVARNVLPLSTYSTFTATVDPLNLMRFLSLRNHPSALQEIRDYALVLELILKEKMPVTHQAFIDSNRFGMESKV